MYILNIAEKPSVAKSISKVLGQHQNLSTKRGRHKYCSNISFKYNDDRFIFTSVLGHIYNLNFTKKYSWELIDPKILFYESLVKSISDDFIDLRNNIEEQAQKADKAIIWTDCDREGEHIALQIYNIIKSKKNIEVKRARFSGISRTEIINALENLDDINIREAEAVDCRMEMDLRIGASFTILQTLALKNFFQEKQVVSFGPCQIPTLGFVVDRFFEIEEFKKEAFYTLDLNIKKDKWTWKRENIFDKNCVSYFYKMLIDKIPFVTKKETKSVTKYKPLPLRTAELQKVCSSIFKISSHKIMEVAESLYNRGYISYPRTETDSFAKNFNYKSILNKLSKDEEYKNITENILSNLKLPRSGKNNDMAHSPIYPLKSGSGLKSLDRLIYNFISRRFLGSLCEDAKGFETYYEINIDKEVFYIKGLKITDKNFLLVYTFDSWGEKEISEYEINKSINNSTLEIREGFTSPPNFLTESELITLMDKNGIGTDATIHEHIQKIQERQYAEKNKNYIIPKKLGIGLIKSYNLLNLEVSKPFLRRDLEIKLKDICTGKSDKNDVVQSEVNLYSKLLCLLSDKIEILKSVVYETLNTKNDIITKNYTPGNNFEKPEPNCDTVNKHNIDETDDEIARTPSRPKSVKRTNNKENVVPTTKNNDMELKNKDDEISCRCKRPTQYSPIENVIMHKCGHIPPLCNFEYEEEVKCKCNYAPKTLTSFTEANNNRRFFKCKKSYKPCKFFKWAESKLDQD